MGTVIIESAGPRNAWSDPESGLRYYLWEGRKLPSVTSIRRLAGVPFGLHQWMVSKIVERAVESHAELEGMLTREKRPRERALEKNRRAEAGKWLRAATTEERDAAAALGTAVHDAAASGLRPEGITDIVTLRRDGKDVDVDGAAVRSRLRQYLDWLQESGFEVLLAERQCFNLRIGYAGTFDLLARARDGSLWIVDIKTGKGTYAEHVLQLLAYLMAEFVGDDDVIDQEATALLLEVSGIAILHLRDDGWSFIRPIADADAWAAFRGLLSFATWSADHQDAATFTVAAKSGADGAGDTTSDVGSLGHPDVVVEVTPPGQDEDIRATSMASVNTRPATPAGARTAMPSHDSETVAEAGRKTMPAPHEAAGAGRDEDGTSPSSHRVSHASQATQAGDSVADSWGLP